MAGSKPGDCVDCFCLTGGPQHNAVLSAVGAPLAVLAALIAVFDPFAAFFTSQPHRFSPDPPGFPLTLAQMFVVAWVMTLPFNGCMLHLWAVGAGMRCIKVFIVMWAVIGFVNQTPDEPLPDAFVTAAILASYLPRVQGNYNRLLWMLALGCSLAVLGYMGHSFWGSLLREKHSRK